FFFFSSRRRHTRSKRDWSSDVCSSDLPFAEKRRPFPGRRFFSSAGLVFPRRGSHPVDIHPHRLVAVLGLHHAQKLPAVPLVEGEIGRASCRERVCIAGAAVT